MYLRERKHVLDVEAIAMCPGGFNNTGKGTGLAKVEGKGCDREKMCGRGDGGRGMYYGGSQRRGARYRWAPHCRCFPKNTADFCRMDGPDELTGKWLSRVFPKLRQFAEGLMQGLRRSFCRR